MTTRFDVFLSHNARDKPVVERIALKLKENGLEPWFDKWYLTSGGKWQDDLAAGLHASSAYAVFIGANGFGDWQREELAVAQNRATKERAFRLFLVLLPGLSDPFDYNSVPPFLLTRNWVDLRKGIEPDHLFQNLINAIKGVAPGPEELAIPGKDVCPYRGLQTFDEEHAEFFFGRNADIQRLIEKLKATRFLAVVGASGSGKSSLVRAGLIPILRKNALPDSNTWNIHVLTPGAHPLTTLAAHLARLYPHDAMHKTLDQLGNDERTMHLAVALALAERPAAERVVWVVDQFEEAFTLCRDERERAQFIANLLYAASIPDSHNIGVLTLRADFYPKCTAYPELSALIAAQQFLVSPMSIDGLRQAIEEPARRVGLEFEKGLVETILDDVENQPGALPLLEHALLELWERRHRGILTLEGYRDSGGVGGAIAKRADAIYNAFSPDQQAITRRIMLRLTQLGEGTEDTRRRAAMSELVTRSEESEVVESVVHALADARLVITSSDNSDEQWIDVSHEALIRGWPHLRQWIDEDRAGLRVHRRLTESAQEWQRLWHDQSVLYRGARLSEVMSWHRKTESTLNDLEYEFLNASIELQKREAQELERKADRDGQIRRELARELHDGPSQLLTAVIMGLKFLKQIIQRQPERVEAELDELERLITQALHQVRNMMFDLRPVALETQGLHAAIKLYSERQTKDSRLNLQVDPTTMDVRFPPEVESAAFSIIQEAVANARKHAHAKTILITVQKTEDSLVLTVRDDGRGFDLVNVESTYDQHVTFGLLNMREQAERCHGKLRIESKIGEGTQIILDIPLRWQI